MWRAILPAACLILARSQDDSFSLSLASESTSDKVQDVQYEPDPVDIDAMSFGLPEGSGQQPMAGEVASGELASGELASGGLASGGPVSGAAISGGPVSQGPVSGGPVSQGPVSGGPISQGPVSHGQISQGQISGVPISQEHASAAQTSRATPARGTRKKKAKRVNRKIKKARLERLWDSNSSLLSAAGSGSAGTGPSESGVVGVSRSVAAGVSRSAAARRSRSAAAEVSRSAAVGMSRSAAAGVSRSMGAGVSRNAPTHMSQTALEAVSQAGEVMSQTAIDGMSGSALEGLSGVVPVETSQSGAPVEQAPTAEAELLAEMNALEMLNSGDAAGVPLRRAEGPWRELKRARHGMQAFREALGYGRRACALFEGNPPLLRVAWDDRAPRAALVDLSWAEVEALRGLGRAGPLQGPTLSFELFFTRSAYRAFHIVAGATTYAENTPALGPALVTATLRGDVLLIRKQFAKNRRAYSKVYLVQTQTPDKQPELFLKVVHKYLDQYQRVTDASALYARPVHFE